MAQYLDTKETVTVESVEEPTSWTSGTAEDQYDMTRIGKKQELRVCQSPRANSVLMCK